MKKILESLVALATLVAIILAGAEEPDGGMDVSWTLTMLIIVFVLGLVYNFFFKEEKDEKDSTTDAK